MSRVVKEVVDHLMQPLRDSVGTERLKLRVKRDRGDVSLRAGHRVGDQLVQPQFFEVLFRGSRASSIRLVTRVAKLRALFDDIGEQLIALLSHEVWVLKQDLCVGPQAGDWRAQLVRRVGDELTLVCDRSV